MQTQLYVIDIFSFVLFIILIIIHYLLQLYNIKIKMFFMFNQLLVKKQ